MPIPVTLGPVQTRIHADRPLVFQYLTAFGVKGPDRLHTTVVL